MKDTAKIWHKLIERMLIAAGMITMDSVPSVLTEIGTIAICYVDDLLVLVAEEDRIEELKVTISEDCVMKDLSKPGSFFSIEYQEQEIQSF